jgi:hypothetical protein
LIKLSFDFSPLVLVPSKLKLALLISLWCRKETEDPRGIGINRLSGAVMYSIKSALRIMAS